MSDLSIEELFQSMVGKKISVVGDFVFDYNRILTPKALSAESPTIIFKPSEDEWRYGAAGNVYNNLLAFGIKARLVTVFGNQKKSPSSLIGKSFFNVDLLAGDWDYVFDNDRATTIKERIVTRRQQLLRIDLQSPNAISEKAANELLEVAMPSLEEADVIIFSDYAHGVCIYALVRPIIEMAIKAGKKIVVDSKADDTISKYAGCTIAMPNLDEAKAITKLYDFEEDAIAKFLRKSMVADAIAVTLGSKGVFLSTATEQAAYSPLAEHPNQEVVDVTGAGDTFTAAVAAGLSVGMPYNRLMQLASVAAGVKVQKRGVATATPNEIIEAAKIHGVTI